MTNTNINGFICELPISSIENIIRNNLPFHDIFFDIKGLTKEKVTIFILEDEEYSIINYSTFFFYASNKEITNLNIKTLEKLWLTPSLESLINSIEVTTSIISKLTKALSLTYKDNSSITFWSSSMEIYSYIYFPYIEVTNKHKSFSIIKEVYVCFKYYMSTMSNQFDSRLFLTRTLVSDFERRHFRYFSHTHKSTTLPETPSPCCLGDTGFAQSFSELCIAKDKFNINLLIGTLFQVEEYLKYESLEGGPYFYMRETIETEIRNYYNVADNITKLVNDEEALILILKVLKEPFISYLATREHLKDAYEGNYIWDRDLIYEFMYYQIKNDQAKLLYDAIEYYYPDRIAKMKEKEAYTQKSRETGNLYDLSQEPKDFNNKILSSNKIGIKFKGENLVFKVVPSIIENKEELAKYIERNLIPIHNKSNRTHLDIIRNTVNYIESNVSINRLITGIFNEYKKKNNINQSLILK